MGWAGQEGAHPDGTDPHLRAFLHSQGTSHMPLLPHPETRTSENKGDASSITRA